MNRARQEALLAWYDRFRRPLPWRATRDPYAILVSEVMAQQTQISRVLPHYERFMEQFPSVDSLSAAPLAEVIAAWSGLGYNRRARYLRDAARRVADHGWPATASELQTLPGVGPYTAAAVACFAFGEPVATVDTNIKRVLSRWEGRELTGVALEETAAAELDRTRAGDWNQAVMDLGARVCHARDPDCAACPVVAWCRNAGVYSPPPRQSRFAGSPREARGAVVKALVAGGPATEHALMRATGLEPGRVQEAVESLAGESMIFRTGGSWALSID